MYILHQKDNMAMSKKDTEKRIDLSMLIDMANPENVIAEVFDFLKGSIPEYDMKRLKLLFADVVSLYKGSYPGYIACNTEYHNLRHTTDVFLCLARLIHGYSRETAPLKGHSQFLALTAAMMHDTGYIQPEGDNEGTGAKYTKEHVARSVIFMKKYFANNRYNHEEFEYASRLVLSTSIDLSFGEIPFIDEENREMGGLLFAADLIGQMSDRVYLEKLLFLFREFDEARVMGFESEMELLNKTIGFYKYIRGRLDNEVSHHDISLRRHFIDRFNIDRNLYLESIENNMSYLSEILEESKDGYRSRLNREGIVKMLEEQENSKYTKAGK